MLLASKRQQQNHCKKPLFSIYKKIFENKAFETILSWNRLSYVSRRKSYKNNILRNCILGHYVTVIVGKTGYAKMLTSSALNACIAMAFLPRLEF